MTGLKTAALVIACSMLGAVGASAQALPPPKAPADTKPHQSLKVQVVLSRYQGDKKVSSLPYTLTVTTNDRPTSLRMGAQVPVGTSFSTAGGAPPVQSFSYRDVGTSIDCGAYALEGGKYGLRLTVEDSSVYPDDTGATAPPTGHPSFRSFRSDQTIVLADGQSAQYTTATDKVTGEVVKVDVTLTVLK
jgi:type II secretory pathway component GspD/PulD (secretin)